MKLFITLANTLFIILIGAIGLFTMTLLLQQDQAGGADADTKVHSGIIPDAPDRNEKFLAPLQQASGDYCFGQYEWNLTRFAEPVWAPPDLTDLLASLDLRSVPNQSQRAGIPGGHGFFRYGRTNSNPALSCYGGDLSLTLRLSEINSITDLLGKPRGSIEAQTLIDVVWELVTTDADPTGDTFAKGLIPSTDLKMELWLGGNRPAKSITLRPEIDPEWARVLALHQEDYAKVRSDLRGRFPANDPRRLGYLKYLGNLKFKYHITHTVFLRGLPDEGIKFPETIIQDTFTISGGDVDLSAHNPTPDGNFSWVEDTGDIDVIDSSDRANSNVADFFSVRARADFNLSTDDHRVSAILNDLSANDNGTIGLMARRDGSATQTYYRLTVSGGTDEINFFRVNTGSSTFLTNTVCTACNDGDDDIRFEVNGSDLEAFNDGSSVLTHTDGSPLSGQLQCGITGSAGGGTPNTVEWNNWFCEDFTATVTGTATAFTY